MATHGDAAIDPGMVLRILCVADERPWPERSGYRIRLANALRGLARVGTVDLLVLHGDDAGHHPWNPSDYAHHLTRRARGLPFWFSLATHGTDAYGAAVEQTLQVAWEGATLIAHAPHLELLMEPELSVVLFRRHGWTADDYQRWSDRALADGVAFVVPTSWNGETVLRICVVNPRTTVDDIRTIVDSLVEEPE